MLENCKNLRPEKLCTTISNDNITGCKQDNNNYRIIFWEGYLNAVQQHSSKRSISLQPPSIFTRTTSITGWLGTKDSSEFSDFCFLFKINKKMLECYSLLLCHKHGNSVNDTDYAIQPVCNSLNQMSCFSITW